jgi:streptomycin 6-kinase
VAAIDIPDRLRDSVEALGAVGVRWLVDLPELLAGLEEDWGIRCGSTLAGGNAAYVAEAATAEGGRAVVKVAVPDGVVGFTPFGQEVEALRRAGGDPYVGLIRHDDRRRSLLLERLGRPLATLGWSITDQLTAISLTVARGWQRGADASLPGGVAKATWLADFIAAEWEESGRPCSEAAVARAVSFARDRVQSLDPDRYVLVHGDAHRHNLLELPAAPGPSTGFRLIDPEGLWSEPAHDLGVVLRDWNEELLHGDAPRIALERCHHVATLTRVDPEPIWQWAFAERLSSGLFLLRHGHEREARPFLEAADLLVGVTPGRG